MRDAAIFGDVEVVGGWGRILVEALNRLGVAWIIVFCDAMCQLMIWVGAIETC